MRGTEAVQNLSCSSLRLILYRCISLDPTLSIWWHDVDRCAAGRGKHSRSIREDHVTLYLRYEVFSRHLVYLRVADVCRWGGRRPQGATPRASVIASHSCSLIYIRQYLLRFGSVCRVIHSNCQARSGYYDRDVHPPDIHRSTEFIFIGIVPQSRFIWWVSQDRGQRMWEIHRGQPSHPYGGPKRGSVPQQLKWVSHY
jgi:hypothetical protein